MTPVEYLKVSKIAEWKMFKPGEIIIQEGMPVKDLHLIYNGTVDVVVKDKKVADLKDGQFVGEMSFLTEKPATATCVVRHNAELLVWRQREFKELLKRNPSLYYSIQSLLSAQLVSISSK
jgi:CRP-like cAMP-binding protein